MRGSSKPRHRGRARGSSSLPGYQGKYSKIAYNLGSSCNSACCIPRHVCGAGTLHTWDKMRHSSTTRSLPLVHPSWAPSSGWHFAGGDHLPPAHPRSFANCITTTSTKLNQSKAPRHKGTHCPKVSERQSWLQPHNNHFVVDSPKAMRYQIHKNPSVNLIQTQYMNEYVGCCPWYVWQRACDRTASSDPLQVLQASKVVSK